MPDHPSNRPAMESVEELFASAIPRNVNQEVAYSVIRSAAGELVMVILGNCPPCADTTAAVRKVREAVMTASAAILLDPPADSPATV